MKYKKRKHWDRHRPEFLKIGFIFALAITFMAFNYTTTPPMYSALGEEPEIVETLIIPPPTAHKKKVPLPPPPPPPKLISTTKIEPVKETIIDFEPEVEIEEDVEVIVDEFTNAPVAEQAPMIELVKHTDEEETPLLFAQRMPVYGGCADEKDETKRRNCTQKNLLTHIYRHTKYPALAREYDLEGTVVASFVVNKEGKVEDIKIVKDIGLGCGEEVKRSLRKLDGFQPGKQNGRPVSVIYRIPVKFSFM